MYGNSLAKIVIQHLDDNFDERWVKDNFSKYGTIINIEMQQRKNRKRLESVFVQYASKDSVPIAIHAMNGKRFGGRIISVSVFEENNFQKNRNQKVFQKEEDIIGKEEGLEPPAYQKFPRRDAQYLIDGPKIPRPKTPSDAPKTVIPVPPPFDPEFFRKEEQSKHQNSTVGEIIQWKGTDRNDERRARERHERHSRERDMDEYRSREEKREHRYHNRDRDRDSKRDYRLNKRTYYDD